MLRLYYNECWVYTSFQDALGDRDLETEIWVCDAPPGFSEDGLETFNEILEDKIFEYHGQMTNADVFYALCRGQL